MFAEIQKRWRQIKRPLEAVVIILSFAVLLVLIILIITGYLLHWTWTGLSQKTLWDWLQLLIIPAVLAVGGYLFNFTTTRTEQESTRQRDQTERDLILDNQREAALQAYIDKISELLVEKKLRESQPEDEVRTIARVRTLTTLPRLDNERKSSILQFLYESKLIEKDKSIVTLSRADLRGARGGDLSRANLFRADLREANLHRANLAETNLRAADLVRANLSQAKLSGAILVEAYLGDADLRAANLLVANLRRANLRRANLRRANLSGANLGDADLSGANLSGAKITQSQLDSTISHEDAILPYELRHQ